MEPLSIVGAMILIIIILFLGKILSHLARFFFVVLVIFFFLILIFGVSLDQLINWTLDFLLVAI